MIVLPGVNGSPDLAMTFPNAKTALTERQEEVIGFIVWHLLTRGYSPTVSELLVYLGSPHPTAAYCHLLLLRKKGVLEWEKDRHRTFRPVGLVWQPVGGNPDGKSTVRSLRRLQG